MVLGLLFFTRPHFYTKISGILKLKKREKENECGSSLSVTHFFSKDYGANLWFLLFFTLLHSHSHSKTSGTLKTKKRTGSFECSSCSFSLSRLKEINPRITGTWLLSLSSRSLVFQKMTSRIYGFCFSLRSL
jgi:hypothetical protein